MKVYLAGPDVFEPNAKARGEHLKQLCTRHGLEGLFPLDNELTSVELGSVAMADAIRTANMDLIRKCDAILANMTPFRGPSMDVGTAYEMGVGAALGKVVVGYTTQAESYVEKVRKVHRVERAGDGHLRDESGMSVEEFGKGEGEKGLVDNLMISCGVEKLCGSEEEGLKNIAEILKGRK
ncbi:nucleoside 2-deoxyribosyltransferase [Acephala macrosclerotiorum]|nr:nucleoside 2-deoxyribosyltransferase [Acephala macrosclerotiorum]